MRFPIELGGDFTSLDDRSRAFNCVSWPMLYGRVEIFVLEIFNSHNFIRAPIEYGRLSSSEYDQSSFSKLTRFPIELGRDFTLLDIRSKAFKCVNFLMRSLRAEIFVVERFSSCQFVRAPIESRRLSSLELNNSSLSKLMQFPIELGRDFTLLDDRSRAFKCVSLSMLSACVDILVVERFNIGNFIRSPIQSGKLSSSKSNNSSLSKS